MNNKKALKSIIKFLSKTDFYFCKNYDELFNLELGENCYCADDLLQTAYDNIYVSVKEILAGYYLDPKNDLTDEAKENLINEVLEIVENYHIFFNKDSRETIEAAINNIPKLKQILTDRFTETAHK